MGCSCRHNNSVKFIKFIKRVILLMNYAVAKNNGYSIKKDNTKNLFHIELLDEQQKPVNLTGTSIKILGTTNKQSVIINKLVRNRGSKMGR